MGLVLLHVADTIFLSFNLMVVWGSELYIVTELGPNFTMAPITLNGNHTVYIIT